MKSIKVSAAVGAAPHHERSAMNQLLNPVAEPVTRHLPDRGTLVTEVPPADASTRAIRAANSGLCLLTLRSTDGPMTVSEIAAATGLSRPTVVTILGELVSTGVVQSSYEPMSCTRGRPPRRFQYAPAATLVGSVEVGPSSITCAVFDGAGDLLASDAHRFFADNGSSRLDAVIRAVREATRLAADSLQPIPGDDHRAAALSALGVAVPGHVDADGVVRDSPTVPDWTGIDVGHELSARLGCPVTVENDSRLAAYAEHRTWGGTDDLIYLRIGRHVAVAAMVAGQILHGSHRLAGDLGSQRGMQWSSNFDDGGLRWSTGRDAAPLFERARAGDQQAIAEIDAFCSEIAPRIATLVLAIDPKRVVLGGGLAEAGDVLLLPLRQYVNEELMTPEKPIFHPAVLGAAGTAIGAAGLAFERSSAELFGVADVPAPWARLATVALPT